MTIKERLIIFIKSQKMGQAAFEKKIGLSNGYVNNIRKSIQPDKLQRIALIFPQLNAGWLMTGEGEMLKRNNERPYNQSIVGDYNVQAGHNSNIRQYYSDSPDVLRAQIEEVERLLFEKEERIKEKDAQIKEKDAQINKLLSILSNK
jgi:transcriptional regulator with XRE-family HTH domain